LDLRQIRIEQRRPSTPFDLFARTAAENPSQVLRAIDSRRAIARTPSPSV
jgi:hypothetical protein